MAFKLAPRTRQYVTSTGTIGVAAVLNLGGVTGIDLNSFVASVGDNNQTIVCVVSGNGSDWQECAVTIDDASPDTLTVNEILASSIAGVVGVSPITLVGTSRAFGIIPTDFSKLFDYQFGNTNGDVIKRVGGVWTQAVDDTGSGGITALTGNVTASGTGSVAATIANDAVTNARLANVATATFKGRTTTGTGDPEDLTATQATALLNTLVGDSGSGGTKGLAPAPAAGDAAGGKYLDAAGAYSVPPGSSGITQLTGDAAAGPGSGSQAITIANDAVTNAKLANIATARFKGRTTAGTGDPEDLTGTQATALLDVLVGDSGSGGTKGLVPAPAAGDAAAGRVLGAASTWIDNPQTFKKSIAVASTSPLPSSPTYSNGIGGTGATLTAGSNGAISVDGVSAALAVGDRVLVAGQADAKQNGPYVITQLGNGSNPYILTRASDWNGAALTAGNIQLGDTFSVYSGSTNPGLWAFTAFSPGGTVTFGTSLFTFTRIASAVVAFSLAGATDATISSPANDDFLAYDTGTSKWLNRTHAQATARLDVVVGDSGSGGTKGLVPAAAAGDAAAGKFLSAGGTYAVPGGAITLVGTLTASASAALDFTGLTGTYWRLVGKLLRPTTNAVNGLVRIGTGGGPTFATTGYYIGGTRVGVTLASSANFAATNVGGFGGGQTQSNSSQGQSFVYDIMTDNANWVHITGFIIDAASADGHTRMTPVGGIVAIAGQLTGFRYLQDSGTIAQGKLSLYSIAA